MARQDYTGGNQDQMDRQSAAAAAAGRPDVDTGSQGEGSDNTIRDDQFRLNGGPNSTVITRTPLQQQRFQTGEDRMDRMRAFGVNGDYRRSPEYIEYLSTTGRSVNNPYGPSGISGIFGKIVGEENIRSPESLAERQKVLDIGFDRYMNFDQLSDLERRVGFGSLFGGPEGEQLANGQTVAKQVAPMSTSEMGARLLFGLKTPLGPILSLIPGNNVSYVSTGNEEVYDVERDPRFNKDLSSGIMGNIGKMFTGGVDPQDAGRAVMDLSRQGLASLTERFGANDLDVPAGVMDNLEDLWINTQVKGAGTCWRLRLPLLSLQ